MKLHNKKGAIRAEFQNLANDAVRAYGGKVIEFIDYGYCSYIVVHAQIAHKTVYIVASHSGYIAFTYSEPKIMETYSWVDIPDLAKHFRPYFKVLSAKKLNEETTIVGHHSKNTLCYLKNDFDYDKEAWSYDLDYWRPKTIGEIIFNGWD